MGSDTRYRSTHKVRFVTASALFDGHDVSINMMRRMLQASGAEVIHLGHNRSVDEVVRAAIQEDVQGIAISSYQGGHMEYFTFMLDALRENGASHIRVYGGGGGVILPSEIKKLHEYGVARIFTPDDGRELGLQGMINVMMRECDYSTVSDANLDPHACLRQDQRSIAQFITAAENRSEGRLPDSDQTFDALQHIQAMASSCPVVGVTGTGGAGKSSLTDELVRRFLRQFPDKSIAILSVDPTKRRTGGALLGDRIRMNAVHSDRVYMRSLATRGSGHELSNAIRDVIQVVKAAGFDLIMVETSGIGQGDHQITAISDVFLYVMTSEFGAPSQLEKIDMLDDADLIAINKFDRKGSLDALRDVKKQYQRNHGLFDQDYETMPVYGTMASQFNDAGVHALFHALIDTMNRKCSLQWPTPSFSSDRKAASKHAIIPNDRIRYLGEIAQTVRDYRAFVTREAELASSSYRIDGAIKVLQQHAGSEESLIAMSKLKETIENNMHKKTKELLSRWPEIQRQYTGDTHTSRVRDKDIVTELTTQSLSGLSIPKVSLPKFRDWGDLLRWICHENVPGEFPYTAGVFPFKRTAEDPKRQFAGEGTPERTNLRFHYLSQNDPAKRLSTAFDSVTLYGENPDYRLDIYGKIGESGVSICTLNDMKKLYAGFDLCHPMTSVSMTINGPAPVILAMYMNTAIDMQLEKFRHAQGRSPTSEEAASVRRETLRSVRGTVQADILKEDQGQNTCIFSTEFALRMMGDIQQYFIDHEVRNYYSVSISGYHIAEAGANPISQLAFTLSNGFTYVEYYLSRGMAIDDFAPNLSFFFSNGLDPEYTVIGRVARRIWAIVMKNKYKANERSQKLKYHIQTSGRSLHAQEIDFNDIRTTLQALMAILDNCNSLHTNSYDEAITTPTEESVRRAMAIQLIITKELGFVKNENMLQGSFIIEELTDLVEEAVLLELERISERGGVLGAMESQYQRGKIQDESMLYEMKKHNGELPVIGVNTFRRPDPPTGDDLDIPLARATPQEKEQQIKNLVEFHTKNQAEAPPALAKLQLAALEGGNIFAELMETVKVASLGQITHALYEVGGQYRRNM
ncbi:fused isobutyryl-CoA mutase/GTPase IcmF [Paenibacillus sedimenti]|uniref:Fused isobutyryl-CoA mutase n=1 Tax=Paenibacillus sedimenti TaxID=2770274 RepID=A0A926QJ75_9BACL|nr:fused isobutyryl-CoA mutase/GTPase IcmF [Paenibacillus sedimenti]MBD0380214.1 methylmalonyl-CoA mutase family protein [Paenibacillus sedimenti]